MKSLITIFLFMVSVCLVDGAQSSTFVPLGIERQVEQADGAIFGIYRDHHYKRLNDGTVVTEAKFEVLKYSGIAANDIVNKKSFSVLFPGGQWQGMNYRIKGAPKFKEGEKFLLLVSRGQHGFTLSNFTLGKYNVSSSSGGDYTLSSSVFPRHQELGSIKMEVFNRHLEQNFGAKLSAFENDKFINNKVGQELASFQNISSPRISDRPELRAGRTPASLDNYKAKQERAPASNQGDDKGSFLWIALTFFAMGAYAAVMRRKQRGS